MQIISLGRSTLALFTQEFLPLFPRDKLLIIRLLPDFDLSCAQELQNTLSSRALNFFYSLNESEFQGHFLFQNRAQLGLTRFLITQELDHPSTGPVNEKVYRDTPHLTGASERMHEYGWRYSDVTFYTELRLQSQGLNFVASFAKYYFELGRDFLLLDPADLSFEEAPALKRSFDWMKMYVAKKSGIYFSPDHPRARNWEALTENVFRGPRIVDIDVANTCTHNCNFCGLYNEEILKKHLADGVDGKFQPPIEKQYQAKIDTNLAKKLIAELPHRVEHLTFGGLGDPFTHPDILEFIQASLRRGFKTTVYSNYAYMNEDKLERMHSLCSANPFSLHFIVNLSAASGETYAAIRPNQTAKTFERVLKYLKLSSTKRQVDGRGITFTLMSVTNATNYRDMPDLVARALETGAMALWIKPMEIHGEGTLAHLIREEELMDYAYHAKTTLALARFYGVELKEEETLKEMGKHFKESLNEAELIERWRAKSKLFKDLTPRKVPTIHELYQVRDYPDLMLLRKTAQAEIKVKTVSRSDVDSDYKDRLGVSTAGAKSSFYDTLSCHIALEYVRIEVDGKVLPCCISNHALASLKGESFFELWTNGAFETFRSKLARINVEKFHRTDPQWYFCEQCVHTDLNREFHLFAGRALEVKN